MTSTDTIRFDDGGAYERYMGTWSQLAGQVFLEWLAPAPQLRWLDVGCGNGAFTELIFQRCAPSFVEGVDPSEAQIDFARRRFASRDARFQIGDAMKLPVESGQFDIAVMPLVIFFVPEPAVGVAEMARAVRPGGLVAAYGWDIVGNGFPYAALQAEMRAIGAPVLMPPRPEASRIEDLRSYWSGAGLEELETREITIERTFTSFEDYWQTVSSGPSVSKALASLAPEPTAILKERLRTVLSADAQGRITYPARANAIQGRVPRGT